MAVNNYILTTRARALRPIPTGQPSRPVGPGWFLRTALAVTLIVIIFSMTFLGTEVPQPSQNLEPNRKWAFVIGVSRYTHAPRLQFATADALAFVDVLESPLGGSFPPHQIIALLEQEATRDRIIDELARMESRVRAGDTVYVFIAGHGFLIARNGYFLPADGHFRASRGVSFAELRSLIEAGLAQAGVRVLLTDLCHAGLIGTAPLRPAEEILRAFGEEVGSGPRTFLNLMASGPLELSEELKRLGHGAFTYSLLEGLSGKARPGAEMITAANVVDYVRREVPRLTGFAQNPLVNPDFNRELVLSYPAQRGPASNMTPTPTVLVIRDVDRSPYKRVEWTDSRTQSRVVVPLRKDRPSVRLSTLEPGRVEFSFFDEREGKRDTAITVEPGINVFALDSLSDSVLERVVSRIASAGSVTLGRLLTVQEEPADADATLMLQVAPGTEVSIDGNAFYRSTASQRLMIAGLQPGIRQLRLDLPDRESRFRLRLSEGRQILDVRSGELRFVRDYPSRVPAPPGVPAEFRDRYIQLQESLSDERLIGSADSAWEQYVAMRERLPLDVQEDLRHQVVVAMGNRAERTILRYLRGGDIRWTPEAFDEGALLSDRVLQSGRRLPSLEARKLFFEGRALVERGRYPEAIAKLDEVIRLEPQASYAWNAKGLALWRLNRLSEAVVPLEESIRLSPAWTYPRNTLSLIRLEQRRYDEAESGLRASIATDPEDSTAYNALAQLFLLSGRLTEADLELNRALDFNPGNAYAYGTQARLRQAQGRRADAESLFRLAMRLEPDEPAFRAGLADLLRDEPARIAEAEGLYRDAVNRAPANLAVVNAATRFYLDRNRSSDARRIAENAVRNSPDDSNLRVLYGLTLQKQRQFRSAEKQFRRSIRLSPGNAFAYYDLAIGYLEQRRLRDAEKAALSAIAADPRFASAQFLMARIRTGQTRFAEALPFLTRALDLAIEPNQRQELCDARVELQRSIIQERIRLTRRTDTHSHLPEIWGQLVAALRDALAESEALERPCAQAFDIAQVRASLTGELREPIAQFAASHPGIARIDDLPEGSIRTVLASRFWRNYRELDRRWLQKDASATPAAFLELLESADPLEIRAFASTAFSLGNPEGIHALIHTWAERAADRREYGVASRMMDAAFSKRFFCEVSSSPPEIDSLLVPEDGQEAASCSDFDVALHIDPRAHEILARTHAGNNDMPRARTYLIALERNGPHVQTRLRLASTLRREGRDLEALAILGPALENGRPGILVPELFLAVADLQVTTGDSAAALRTLNEGRKNFPRDRGIRDALRARKNP